MGEKSRGNYQIGFGDRKKVVLVGGEVKRVPWDWMPGDPLPKEYDEKE